MGELLANPGFWVMALVVSAVMVMVFYQDIKAYKVDKEMVGWKLSKGHITDEQAAIELRNARMFFVRNIIFCVAFYYIAFFLLLLGIGILAFIVMLLGGVFTYRAPRWRPWNPL